MKAICISKPNECSLIDVSEPGELREGEVLLKVRQVGLCGSDLTSYRGLNPLVLYPRVPGHEIGATIERIGAGVPSKWVCGQRVLVSPYTSCGECAACKAGRVNSCRSNETLGVQRDGALTEYLVVSHHKLFSSASLSIEEMALVEPLTVGFHAVARGDVSGIDTVAVVGCGAIGLGAIAGASARNARVIAVDIDDAKLALARDCGASDTINSDRENLSDRLKEMTDGEGPCVMIEAAGSPEMFRACIEIVCFTGRVVYIGYAKAPVSYDTKLFVMKELDIRGSRNALPEDFEAVIEHLESGRFPSKTVVTRTVSLEEAPAALVAWNRDPSCITRVHVRI